MTIRNSLNAMCLVAAVAAAISLIAAAPGLGAPAGDEYLPAVPSAKGDQGGSGGGDPAPGVAPGVAAGAAAVPGSTTEDGKAGSAGSKAKGEQQKPEIATVATAASEEEDSSGVLDTLLDPVVLLLIGGVVVVAVGMTLRRRQGDDESQDPDRPPRDPAAAPHTPPGEIVADGERRS